MGMNLAMVFSMEKLTTGLKQVTMGEVLISVEVIRWRISIES